MKLSLLLLLLRPAFAQEHPSRALFVSIAAVGAASAADIVANWHRPEENPILGSGRLGPRGASIKLGTVAAVAVLEWKCFKSRKLQGIAAVSNFAVAGELGWAAGRKK